MMFIILLLIRRRWPAFNIVSTWVMAVHRTSSPSIAILRTLGRRARRHHEIFIVQGAADRRDRHADRVAGRHRARAQHRRVVPFLERLLNVQFLSREVYYIPTCLSDSPEQRRGCDLRWYRSRSRFFATLSELARRRVNPAEALAL